MKTSKEGLIACGLILFSAFCVWDAMNGSRNAVRNMSQQASRREAEEERQQAADEKKARAAEAVVQQREAEANARMQEKERRVKHIVRRELDGYEKGGRPWRNLLVQHGSSRSKLVALARYLHRSDPLSNFRFLDDDKEFKAFMRWDINYPNSAYPYPEAWADKHYIAMINKTTGDNGLEWYLSDQYGQPIAALN